MTPHQGGPDHISSQTTGSVGHRGPEAPLPHGAQGATAFFSPFAEPLQGTATILGGGRALAHRLQLATGDAAGFFSPLGCTKKGKPIPSHHGLENPTGSFDFKLLLNGARVQLLTLTKGSKCVCRRKFAASSLPGVVQPACSRAQTACLGTNPLLWHGRSLLNLSEAGETPEIVKFGTATHREHSPTPDVRMCMHTRPHYLSKADTSLSEVTQATKGTSPPATRPHLLSDTDGQFGRTVCTYAEMLSCPLTPRPSIMGDL